MYLSLTGMSYSDQLESPSVVQTKEAARKIEENELHLAAAPVDLTHVMFWPGKLWEFSKRCVILYVQENDSVE